MREKLKVFGIPIMVMLLFVLALFVHQLVLVKELPQPNWSRSIPLEYTSEERPQVFSNKEDVFFAGDGKVHQFTLDQKLNTKDKVMDTKITRGYPFWADGKKFVYYKDEDLVSTVDQQDTILSSGITGLGTGVNDVYFWSNQELKHYNPQEGSLTNVHSFPSEVSAVHVGDNGSGIVQVKLDDTRDYVYYMDENQEVSKEPFLVLNTSPNKKVDHLTYHVKNEELILLYSEKSRTQGNLSYKVYKVQVPLNEIGSSIEKGTAIEFVNHENGEKLSSPSGAEFVNVSGKEAVMFTSEGQRIGDNSSIKLYLAPYEDRTTLEGLPISTSKHVTYSPEKVGQSLVWLSYDGDTYELFAASQDKEVMAASAEWSSRSVKEAINNGVVMMFSSLITVLTSFYWVLPSLFLLIIMYIFKPNTFETEGINWVEYASIVIFLIMPINYTSDAMNAYFYQMAPDYITFPGGGYALLLLISVVTTIIWKIGRDPDWGAFAGAFYFMGVYILFYITSIGPYIFNLF
ncbi:hypothetical protein [Rossellomorea aquimaris]|uniref:hypothetical protein n=1 Tax=Rossellomorea aquimaris TaxID=189382 RepID=UPI0007D04F31|nr:hypothetical protein [Rossellomorea aquimaris]